MARIGSWRWAVVRWQSLSLFPLAESAESHESQETFHECPERCTSNFHPGQDRTEYPPLLISMLIASPPAVRRNSAGSTVTGSSGFGSPSRLVQAAMREIRHAPLSLNIFLDGCILFVSTYITVRGHHSSTYKYIITHTYIHALAWNGCGAGGTVAINILDAVDLPPSFGKNKHRTFRGTASTIPVQNNRGRSVSTPLNKASSGEVSIHCDAAVARNSRWGSEEWGPGSLHRG